MTTDSEDTVRLRLSAQRALLGHVTANMAAVAVVLEDKKVVLSVYFFSTISELDREHTEEAAADIIADFPAEYGLDTRYLQASELKPPSSWTCLTCVFLHAKALNG